MSPRTSQHWRIFRESKKKSILNAALENFAVTGFHATTMDLIAKSAGISKGLIYTYFKNKEELLSEIIDASVMEIYSHFDPDHDGFLTQPEFEVFVRNVATEVKRNKTAWRLFLQLIMQRDVMEIFSGKYSSPTVVTAYKPSRDEAFLRNIYNTAAEYFERKKLTKPQGYNPDLEMQMFILTFKGFVLTTVFEDQTDEKRFAQTVENIISTYK